MNIIKNYKNIQIAIHSNTIKTSKIIIKKILIKILNSLLKNIFKNMGCSQGKD